MQAVILAGGKGKRLLPYTVVFPKPLMPIGDHPILEVVIRQLKANGFDRVVLAVGYQRELLEAFFNDGSKWSVQISYSVEDKPMGTAGPLGLIENLDDNFLVMNGDILTDLNYAEFFNYHKKHSALCTIASYTKDVKIDLGVIKTNEENLLFDYIEKPDLKYQVSMGIYAFKKEVLDFIPVGEYFDFPDLIKKLLKEDKKVLSYPFDGRWLDIGRLEDYEKAIEEFDKNRKQYLGRTTQ